MNKLVVLVGNIGSGKTTYTHKLVAKGYVAISRDALRYMIGNGKYIFNPKLEPIIFHSEEAIIRNFMSVDANIVVDEVGIDKHTRNRYLELANHFNYQTICVCLPKYSMEECVDRRMQDPHGQPDRALWESVWKKFNKRYQKPTLVEGFDKIIQLKRNIRKQFTT
jgi:predicted kinase